MLAFLFLVITSYLCQLFTNLAGMLILFQDEMQRIAIMPVHCKHDLTGVPK